MSHKTRMFVFWTFEINSDGVQDPLTGVELY